MTKSELIESIVDLADDVILLFIPSFELPGGDYSTPSLAYVDDNNELTFISYVDVVEVVVESDGIMQGPVGEA